MMKMHKPSLSTLYQILAVTFSVVVVISNIISAKMVKIPYTQGFAIPAGLVTYPLTFLISDLVTEVFGAKKAKLMVYMALAMNLLSFGIIQLALLLPSANLDEQAIFNSVLGLSGLRIFSSLTAYLIAQIADIQLYAFIKRWTGARFLWLRNNGSTCLSQLIDTLLIDIIYLYLGLGMSWEAVLPIMGLSYLYKAAFSLANTPLFYLSVFLVKTNWAMPTSEKTSYPTQGLIYGSKV